MKPVIRKNDPHTCPADKHATGVVMEGASSVLVNNIALSYVGAKCHCQSVIVVGSLSVFVEGKPVAFDGSTTNHGGTVKATTTNVLIGG